MSDPDDPLNQQHIPHSFVAVYTPPGRIKPTLSREALLERYGLCEDLAQMLTETALSHRHAMGLSPAEVLERVGRGLTGPDALTEAPESRWVLQRLAELLDWPAPA